ncbi:hypothetical protein BC829DRAFT_394761 [Chytridium lagenaria]|nr:hypothetical protein BC829DRAFT_394761 [Chytridium lagenaria]
MIACRRILSGPFITQRLLSRPFSTDPPINDPQYRPSLKPNNPSKSLIKTSKKSGQKINKRSNCVQLRHIPTNLSCQRFRDLTANRKEARKLLKLKVDEFLNGELSVRGIRIAKEQKRKRKQAQRSKKKGEAEEEDETKDGGSDGDGSSLK